MSILEVAVYYVPHHEKYKMGRLALKGRNIYFEYDASFLDTGIELSPFLLPLKPGVITCEDRLFDGLYGVFNDSLPDGWGRLLLDCKLRSLGMHANDLTPLDRLCYVGYHGMGALVYEPEMASSRAIVHQHLDAIADETVQFLEHDEDRHIDDLLLLNGSSAGARPKILVSIQNNTFVASDVSSQPSENHWLIKFRSSLDPKDNGPIEYAYHLMAKAAGLDVPDARLFESKKGPGYFGVKRFDRMKGQRIHMHTLCGLLHLDHRIPSLDYETLIKVTWRLCHDIREMEKTISRSCFQSLCP